MCAINIRNVTLRQFQEHYAPDSVAPTEILEIVRGKLRNFIESLTVAERSQLPRLLDGFDVGVSGLDGDVVSW